ncbi:DUF1818 family protein [Gloeothece verrucosa]|uniref:DUF1818 domain-containing protein n=1 Tax=Gloeothece verrucosa (strain PCC 7822) TaxID=497965 RepID=E0UBS2_GLOV7|nr:DUF1818 family protein [Gloeothece verrucosa]ADN15137.1 Domain of unknown function DUF1818 [Gloeothece verrucosa PCC 7822]
MKERLLKEGKGWRLGWNPQGEIYKGLVGSEEWAIELTEAELNDFCRLLNQLAETMEEMKQQLMDSEKIACEAESDLLWMEVEGFPHAYSLRLILHQHRRFEGNWAAESVADLVKATQFLKVF